MVTKEELKKIVLLSDLSDAMIDKLIPIIEFMKTEEREVVFRQGDAAERLFMLKRGKILLEQRLTEQVTISVGSVKPGYSFGWSAMLDADWYTSDAMSAEPCEMFAVRSDKLRGLLNEDHSMGYRFNQQLLMVMKRRLGHRTDQLLRVIKNHPDMKPLISQN